MSIKERRLHEIEMMKKKIIGTAINIINDEGYEKLSIRKIAAKIDYSPTTIYLYYKDKAEIIRDMSLHLYQITFDNAAKTAAEHADLPADKRLKLIIGVFIRSLLSEPEMGKAVLQSGLNLIFSKDNTQEPGESGINVLDILIKEGEEQDLFRPLDENISELILTALLGFVLNSIENKLYEADNFQHLINIYADMIIRGLLI